MYLEPSNVRLYISPLLLKTKASIGFQLGAQSQGGHAGFGRGGHLLNEPPGQFLCRHLSAPPIPQGVEEVGVRQPSPKRRERFGRIEQIHADDLIASGHDDACRIVRQLEKRK